MEFGKILSQETVDNQVTVKYENQEVIVQVITDEIIRVLVPTWIKHYKSVAIEGHPEVPCDFEVAEAEGEVTISTGAVVLQLRDNFSFSFKDRYSDELLSSYDGNRTILGGLSEEALALLIAEGPPPVCGCCFPRRKP